MGTEPGAAPGRPGVLSRRRLLFRGAALGALGLGGALAVGNTFDVRVDAADVWLERLPRGWDGARLVFLTDLHRGPFVPQGYLRRCVETARALPHDIAFLGGDYVSVSARHAGDVAALLRGWAPASGLWAVLGNHDYWTDPATVRESVRGAGAELMGNENRLLTRGGDAIRLVCTDDPMTNHDDLPAALAGTGPHEFRLVLSHSPELAWELSEAKVDFVLAGHTHGGQVCLPGGEPIVVPCSPGKALAKGLRNYRGLPFYVSRGVGVTGIPLRTYCPPEITHLTLRRGRKP